MLMEQTKLWYYLAPDFEEQILMVELGFAGSLESPEPDGEL